jgi:hypothetical protein
VGYGFCTRIDFRHALRVDCEWMAVVSQLGMINISGQSAGVLRFIGHSCSC